MNTQDQIETYLAAQPEPKGADMRALHQLALRIAPDARLWFLDGTDETGKVVSNPNIGYGALTMKLAGGKTREFYRVGLSGNTSGVSVYVMGVDDRTYLARTFGPKLGRASVTGYCIKFRALRDVDLETLEAAMRFGLGERG